MRKSRTARLTIMFCVAAASPALADSKAEERTFGSEIQAETESAHPDDPAAKTEPVFVPRDRGAPVARVGGATRGIEVAKIPSIEVLAPERLGYTLDPQPSLYWSLSDSTDHRVEVSLIAHDSDPPRTVFEAVLEGPLEAGVHRIDLARHGVTLEPGVIYMWYVRLDPRSDGRYGGGGIQRVAAPAELEAELAAAGADRKAFILGEAGIWYDAIGVLSEQIESGSAVEPALAHRAALLEQVGLSTPP